jgi:hypothetical protein
LEPIVTVPTSFLAPLPPEDGAGSSSPPQAVSAAGRAATPAAPPSPFSSVRRLSGASVNGTFDIEFSPLVAAGRVRKKQRELSNVPESHPSGARMSRACWEFVLTFSAD